MSKYEVRSDRKYTKDHEWAKFENGLILVGISSYAIHQLGDITLVNLDVKAGDSMTEGKSFGTIESVKTLSDLFAPVSGTIEKVNSLLENQPELVNDSCYDEAWMISIRSDSSGHSSALDALMDASDYEQLLQSIDH